MRVGGQRITERNRLTFPVREEMERTGNPILRHEIMKQDKLLGYLQKAAITAAIMAFLACLFTSCKTTHDVQTEYVDRYVHDSIYIERVDTLVKVDVRRDSVLLHDSVYVSVFQRADTIYKTREVFKYRDRVQIKHDTVYDVKIDVQYKERIDTAYINKEVVKTEYVKKPLSWLQKSLVGLGVISIVICLILIYRKFLVN